MLNILEVVVVLIVITMALFIHEMGHAIAVLLRNKKAKAEVYLGSLSKEKKLKLSLGRIMLFNYSLFQVDVGFRTQKNYHHLQINKV